MTKPGARLQRRIALLALALAFALALAMVLPSAHAADPDGETVLLVAKRELRDRVYGSTILFAKPLGGDRHVGFILNKPTRVTLGKLFPEHPPSAKVAEPVYLGGPFGREVIFALVQRSRHPGGRSVRIMDDLFLAFDTPIVDRIIEKEPDRARFFAGLVVWRQGELRRELKEGMWYVLDARTDLLLHRKTEGLWEELVRRSERKANAI